MRRRQSLASGSRKQGSPEVIQVGTPGLFCADLPVVKGLASAFARTLTVRKQAVLASGVRHIVLEAGEKLDEDLNIKTLNGDPLEK